MAQPTENIPMKDASLVDEFGICQSETPVVSICCITYNHEKFIRDALDGFLIQKTDFPIEIIVRDDASTDATATIVRQYQTKHPNLIRAIYHTQNQYALGKRAFPEVFAMARGKYIALCEGDDYWTDPLKLQKQVDFMESHPDCSICCHKLIERHENGLKADKIFPNIQGSQIFDKEYLYRNFFIRTCTVLFRNVDIEGLKLFQKGFQVGDSPLFHYYAQLGKIGFLDDCMAVYRFHDGGIWSGKPIIKIYLDSLSTRFLLRRKLHLVLSKGFNQRTLELLLNTIVLFKREGDVKKMYKYLLKSIPYYLVADKSQRKSMHKLIKHSFDRILNI
jgi:glycosyltransferase involved in cell wall biosynthesis